MLCRAQYYYSLFHKQMKLLYLLISNRNKSCPFCRKFKATCMPALFHHHVKLLFYASGDMIAQHKQRLRIDWKLYSNISECLMSFHSWSSIHSLIFWYIKMYLQHSLRSFCCALLEETPGCTEAEQPAGDLPGSKSQASFLALWQNTPGRCKPCQIISRNISLN